LDEREVNLIKLGCPPIMAFFADHGRVVADLRSNHDNMAMIGEGKAAGESGGGKAAGRAAGEASEINPGWGW
jgi:hypothetical protein